MNNSNLERSKLLEKAKSELTSKEELSELANSEDVDVRSFVAENPNIDQDTFERLAMGCYAVRLSIAKNTNAPDSILKQLIINDQVPLVRYEALKNLLSLLNKNEM